MRKKNTALMALLASVTFLIDPGCATIVRSSSQRIPVTSAPAGATVYVNGAPQGTAPLVITLDRKMKDHVLRVEYPGYHPVEIRPQRDTSGMGLPIIGNILAGAVLGFPGAYVASLLLGRTSDPELFATWAIGGLLFSTLPIVLDFSSGAAYTLSPKELTVTLEKFDGPPRVATLFLGPDELRNIKWIRVRKD